MPPQPQIATHPVDIPLAPIPQSYALVPGTSNGQRVAYLQLVQFNTAFLIAFDRTIGLQLADELREFFGGIEIAKNVPRPNGKGH